MTTENSLSLDDLHRITDLLLGRNGRLYALAELIGSRLGSAPGSATSGGLTMIYRVIA